MEVVVVEKVIEESFQAAKELIAHFLTGATEFKQKTRGIVICVKNTSQDEIWINFDESKGPYGYIYFDSGRLWEAKKTNIKPGETAIYSFTNKDGSFMTGVTGAFSIYDGHSRYDVAFGYPFAGSGTFVVDQGDNLKDFFNKYSGKVVLSQKHFPFKSISTTSENGTASYIAVVSDNLNNVVKYGDKIILVHHKTGNHLHSHPNTYNSGTYQQQVTCFGGRDYNDYFIIHPGKGNLKNVGDIVRFGETIHFEHVATKNFLHSTDGAKSPTTGQQEVSCYWIRDDNDNWKFTNGNGMVSKKMLLKVHHLTTKMKLHSHDQKMNVNDTEIQQEVTCYGGENEDDFWFIE